jgi:DNA-binding transcriptional MerR regulator
MARSSGNYRRFTEVEKVQMLRLRAEGKSLVEIAKAIHDTYDRVRDWLRYPRARQPLQTAKTPTALPVRDDGFIRPPTRERLMAGR